jgi:glycolate oxidase FAD binding subunit
MSMQQFTPWSAQELAELLCASSAKAQPIQVIGKNSKRLMGGPVTTAETLVNTSRLRRVLRYERDDLTISVEAGMPFASLQSILRENGQMIALDPPFQNEATVGGVLATNVSGSIRRAYGTARDLVIGMTFATLEGKLVKTGGMVVKNVAGLDMGKLMIGSFGTLAVITSANFRVHSLPPTTQTFLFNFKDAEAALQKRDSVLRSVLQPMSLDLISPPAAARLGHGGYLLAIRAGGSTNVLKRYAQELSGSIELSGNTEDEFWRHVREFTPEFMVRQPNGIVLRVSTSLNGIRTLLKQFTGACISRAGSGVSYLCLTSWTGVLPVWKACQENGWPAAIEMAPEEIRSTKELWLTSTDTARANAFDMMEQVKRMFDPAQLLNRSRLYGRI